MRGLGTIGVLAALTLLSSHAHGMSAAESTCLTFVKTKEANRVRIAPCTALLKEAATDKERIPLLLARSEAYYQGEAPLRALLDLDQVERLGGAGSQIAYDRALVYSELGLYARAQPEIDTAMRGGLHSARAYGVRGRISAFQGRYGDAIEDLELSITSDPTLGTSYAVRGFANIEIGEIERAIADLDTAIRLDPKNDFAYGYRARAHLALDQYKEALADLAEAQRLDPDNPGVSDYIAEVHAMLDAPAPTAPPNADPNNAPSRAVGTSHNCMAYYPFLSNWIGETGDVLIHYDVAADGAISGVGIDRSSGYDKLDRAAVICVSRHWRNTPAIQNGVAVASPRHQAIIRYSNHLTGAQIDLRRGETFAGLGNYSRALNSLNTAASEDPRNAEIFLRRGTVFYVTQDYRSAIQDFDKALQLKPGYDEAVAARELAGNAVAAGLAPNSKGI